MENYEEKYKKALGRAKEYSEGHSIDVNPKAAMQYVFPELKESEDEKNRKHLIEYMKYSLKGVEEQDEAGCNRQKDIEALKWGISCLEKLKSVETPKWMIDFLDEHRRHFGTPMDHYERRDVDGKLLAIVEWLKENPNFEQKPVDVKLHDGSVDNPYDMSFEDAQEYTFHRGFDIPMNDGDVFVDERYIIQTIGNILKWADDNPKQKTVEWSKEDEKMLNYACNSLFERLCHYKNNHMLDSAESVEKEINWLKSLSPQQCCKPKESDKQEITWTGDNLKEVIEFTGKYLKYNEWFNSFEEYEMYVHSHDNIFKLFAPFGQHYEIYPGCVIQKTPTGPLPVTEGKYFLKANK